jgi:hypothetical protein
MFSQTVVYNSNPIGQKLKLSDGSSEYTLKVVTEENRVTTFLYLNDKEIKKVEINESGNHKLVVTIENGSVITENYFNNLPVKIINDDDVTSYTYDGGKLITKINKIGGYSQSFSRYYYSGDELVAIFRNLNGNMEYSVFKDEKTPKLLLTKGNTFTEIDVHNTLLTSTLYEGSQQLLFNDATLNEDGSLIIKTLKDGKCRNEYYDADGLLYKEDVLDEDDIINQTSTFEYDKFKNVSRSIEVQFGIVEGSKQIKKTTIYDGGKIQKILLEENGVIISVSVFNEYGKKVETLYKEGLKYCTITYNLDGKKILDVQYEKR